jgi:hypothetical protein
MIHIATRAGTRHAAMTTGSRPQDSPVLLPCPILLSAPRPQEPQHSFIIKLVECFALDP